MMEHNRNILFADRDGDDEIVAEGSSVVHGEPPQDESGPPKVDSAIEVLHEKVTKQIIKEGHGQKPSKYSTCFCKSNSIIYGLEYMDLPSAI